MPLLTVLTAAHAAAAPFIRDTATSVLSQDLAPGWDLEWVVQVDNGDAERIKALLPDDERIKFDSNGGRALGPGPTRNLGLSRARGVWVQNLDADDQLLPGALATLTAVVDVHPSIHWAWGQALDLFPDGRRVAFDPWIEPMGRFPARLLTSWMDTHDGQSPIPCAGVAYRTTTARALGGWVGLPIGEDIALLVAVAELTEGYQMPEATWLYRQHEEQISRGHDRDAWADRARQITLQRITALRLAAASLTGIGHDPLGPRELAPALKNVAEL